MLDKKNNPFLELKSNVSKGSKIVKEIDNLSNNKEEKKISDKQINTLKSSLKEINDNIPKILNNINMKKILPSQNIKQNQAVQKKYQGDILYYPVEDKETQKKVEDRKKELNKIFSLHKIEKETLKRLRKGKKEEKKKEAEKKVGTKPSTYLRISSRLFSNLSFYLIKKGLFKNHQKDLVKANLKFHERGYISITLFTTLLSIFVAFFTFLFFLVFNLSFSLPIITLSTDIIGTRLLKTFWILFLIPISTFLFMYFYPSLERKSIERRINYELPFATINMAAISGSLIDPTRIFSIIMETKEYPYLEKEFIKLMNSINVLGYDLVTALRKSGENTSSKKLSDLFNGLATTITSGGDLPLFFNQRAESLLFEYNLEKEKATKSAETFMDIYISVVIAAPMILMLVLIMMRITGLGLALSTTAITLVIVFGVTMINIAFLIFLHLRQPNL